MDISKYRKDIEKAINQNDGNFGNGILYRMCQENPKHAKPDIVSGKVWLIGRAYAADIARGKKGKINDDFYKKEVGPMLADTGLDEKITYLKPHKEILREENMSDILFLHKYLMDKIKKLPSVEEGKSPHKRSFCSKYLHFHLPKLFFIYDSRVAGALQKLYPGRIENFTDVIDGEVDKVYATFFCKAFVLKNKVKEKLNLDMTPRQLDNFLINEANKSLRNKT